MTKILLALLMLAMTTGAAELRRARQGRHSRVDDGRHDDDLRCRRPRHRKGAHAMRVLALVVLVLGLIAVWMFRFEFIGSEINNGAKVDWHRNRFTGAECPSHIECWREYAPYTHPDRYQ